MKHVTMEKKYVLNLNEIEECRSKACNDIVEFKCLNICMDFTEGKAGFLIWKQAFL